MNWELVKRNILKEISTIIYTIDPAFDIENCLNIYLKILKFRISITTNDDLDGLEKIICETLNKNFDSGQIDETLIGVFCKNFEQFVKKIYYILEESELIERENVLDHTKPQALLPFLTKLNKVRPIYLDEKNNEVYEVEIAKILNDQPIYKKNKETGSKLYKKLYPTNINFDTYTSINDKELNEKYQNNFYLYLIKAIILKNEQSHQAPDRSRIENMTNLNTTLITELWIINFFKKELLNAIKKENYKKKDFDEYIKSQLEKTKKQNSKFVSLILKELANQNETSKNGFIEDLITKNTTRMRILGQGGSGKTTTLEHLVYKDTLKWIETPLNSQIPVLVTLGNLTANESITESIAKKLNIGYEDVEELYKTNEIKIYLDGLNEIVENRESKKIKLQEIDSIIEDYPNLSIIITDRYEFDSYQNNMFNIPTFIIQKLSKNQIEEFVLKNCNNSQEQSNQVLKILNSKSNIQELLLRPLILTRAIEIIKIENDLPEKESQIIEKFLNILLRREKDEKKDPLLNVNNFKLLLSYAANEIYAKYKTNASVHEFSFSKMLNEASEKYGLEKFNAGYVSRIGYELEILSKNEELIQFYHQSYLEFFCSHYLKYEYK
ncbi:hypothetical protein BC749_11348 [Flavobacterium araucananum]|nr:hypothetical protein [Flavobacterium araucananum]PWJ95577.1 hypothetical protein BC749_11348 [Flavobacterium araucananum]